MSVSGPHSRTSFPPEARGLPMSAVLANIEQDLRDLWNVKPGEPLRSRVCTMNLVVVTASDTVAQGYLHIVDEVTQTIPSRAIVVTLDPNSTESSVDGDVVAVRALGEENASSERVRVRAAGTACARVASAALALVVPEIPTALVWLGRVHVDDPIFRELAQDAQRVILDTEYTSLSSLLSLSKWARQHGSRPAVADLAWTRLSAWQEMCARFFDDPAMRPLAYGIDKLALTQLCDKGARLGPEGGLVLGWLATRLGWRLDRMAGATRFRRPDGQPVHLQLRAAPRQEGVAPLSLASLVFTAKADSLSAKGSLEREIGSDVLRYKFEPNEGRYDTQTVRLGIDRGALLLERTLRRPAHDPTLAEAVAFAEQLHEDGISCT